MPFAALLLFVAQAPALARTPTLDLKCDLNPTASSMKIECTVAVPALTTATRRAVFFLSDRMEVPKVRIIEPKDLAGTVTPTVTTVNNHNVTYSIDLSRELPAGERVTLGFSYGSKDARGFVYMLDTRACFAGGYNTLWFPSVGSSRRMLGKLEFKSPAAYVVKASGKELKSEVQGDTRTSRFEIDRPIVPTFAAAQYKVTKVQGAVPMTLYLLKDRPIAKDYAEGCSKILGVLTKEFGPYPFPDFSIIETPSPDSGRDLGFSGASFEGFMFADSNSIDSGFNLAYFGHEMGHQWWGNLVQLTGPRGAYMLSEAMAQFGSLRCVEEIAGPAGATR